MHNTQRKPASNSPQIYVASLSDYNSGRLHGRWLNALDEETVDAGIEAMLKASPEPDAEEWAIHDTEGFGSYSVGEFESLELVCAIGRGIEDHGVLFADFLGHRGAPKSVDDIDDALEAFGESYQGSFGNLSEWAEQFLEDTGALKEVPESLRPYIDFDRGQMTRSSTATCSPSRMRGRSTSSGDTLSGAVVTVPLRPRQKRRPSLDGCSQGAGGGRGIDGGKSPMARPRVRTLPISVEPPSRSRKTSPRLSKAVAMRPSRPTWVPRQTHATPPSGVVRFA